MSGDAHWFHVTDGYMPKSKPSGVYSQ